MGMWAHLLKKKGQITLFLLGAMVILFIGGLLYVYYLNPPVKQNIPDPETGAAVQFLQSCFSGKVTDELQSFGLRGGSPVVFANGTTSVVIPIFYQNGKSQLPKLSEFEASFAATISPIEDECLRELKETLPNSFNVSLESENPIDVKFVDDAVFVDTTSGVSLISSKKNMKLPSSSLRIPVRFGHVYSVVEQLVMRKVESPESLDLLLLASFDVRVAYTPKSRTQAVYTIIDEHSSPPFVFLFSTIIEDNKKEVSSLLHLEPITPIQIKVGETVRGRIQNSGSSNALLFYSYDPLVKMNGQTGEYVIQPTAADVGKHTVKYFAHDGVATAAGVMNIEVQK
jgi:hypothetical protein